MNEFNKIDQGSEFSNFSRRIFLLFFSENAKSLVFEKFLVLQI